MSEKQTFEKHSLPGSEPGDEQHTGSAATAGLSANSVNDPARATAKRIMSALYPDVAIERQPSGGVTGRAVYSPENEHTGAPGWVQGGLSATVLDYVSARIAKAALDSSIATGTLELRYRQPVLIDGGPYEVVGSCEPPHSRTVRVSAAIMSHEGRPLVEASGLFVAVTRNP